MNTLMASLLLALQIVGAESAYTRLQRGTP